MRPYAPSHTASTMALSQQVHITQKFEIDLIRKFERQKFSLFDVHLCTNALHPLVSGNSLSQFQIDAGDLRLGQNTIILTLISASGTTRQTTVQVERTQGQIAYSPYCR